VTIMPGWFVDFVISKYKLYKYFDWHKKKLTISWRLTEKNDLVTATKLGTSNKFFVAATKIFAAATKRFVGRTRHFVVETKYFFTPILTNDLLV